MGVAMLKYSYQCADLNLNVNQGVITAKSFKNTINNWSGMVNLHVPKKSGFLEKNLNVRVQDWKTRFPGRKSVPGNTAVKLSFPRRNRLLLLFFSSSALLLLYLHL